MGFYLGGDRDDENNYATNWHGKSKKSTTHTAHHPPTVEQAIQGVQKGIALPQEFDEAFYLGQRNSFSKSSPDYWEWGKFCALSQAVFALYRQAAAMFYQQFSPADEFNLPSFVDINLRQQDLQPLADNVRAAERALSIQFSKLKTNRTISAKFKRNATLRHLRQHACSAWAMFYALTANLHIADAIKFKQAYINMDLSTPAGLLKTFRGCMVMQHYFAKSAELLSNSIADLYEGENLNQIYANILHSVDGFSTEDCTEILEYVTPKMQMYMQDANFAQLVEFYSNFDAIHKIIGAIRSNAGADAIQQGQKVVRIINSLLATEQDPLIERDLSRLKSMLTQALSANNILV